MAKEEKKKQLAPMTNWVYDVLLWSFSLLTEIFFREVHPRNSWKIPDYGPVIFVAAPHANQFVDPLILMRVIKKEASRRISFLIAEKSMRRKFIGWFARHVGAVPVGRALDSTRPAKGKIYLPDPVNNPTLLRGIDTEFEGKDFQVGGLVVLPTVNNAAASTEILEIKSPEEMILKKPFKGAVAMQQLTGRDDVGDDGKFINGGTEKSAVASGFEGINFKVAPKIDQGKVYDAVFEKLNGGGCVGIFPEGGSHDRTELLPLKPGVAIMALGALAANPNCGVTIIPCGMNYFHAHKFRSRAVVEFGNPVEVPPELVEKYKKGERREAVGQLLDTVYQALVAVTVTSPDYDTLQLIQAVRRLYNVHGKRLGLSYVVELNRRLVQGYQKYKDDPRIIKLKAAVLSYNKELKLLGIRDHQVEYARFSVLSIIFTFIWRLIKIASLSAAVVPGLVLFAPVFIAGKLISIKKSREALAASTVKVQARDVMATWKLLVSLAFAPVLYTFYTVGLTWLTHRNRRSEYPNPTLKKFFPDWIPLTMVVIFGYIFFPLITYAALRFGEVGMDIAKSLKPLILCLKPRSSNTLAKLRRTRTELQEQIQSIIDELGPEMFPDFPKRRIIKSHDGKDRLENDDEYEDRVRRRGRESRPRTPTSRPTTPSERLERNRSGFFGFEFASGASAPGSPTRDPTGAGIGGASTSSGHLPRNESFSTLAAMGIFSSRPGTPQRNRSRTPSIGSGKFGNKFGGLFGMTKADQQELNQSVSKAFLKRRASGDGKDEEYRGGDGEEYHDEDDESTSYSGTITPGSITGDDLHFDSRNE